MRRLRGAATRHLAAELAGLLAALLSLLLLGHTLEQRERLLCPQLILGAIELQKFTGKQLVSKGAAAALSPRSMEQRFDAFVEASREGDDIGRKLLLQFQEQGVDLHLVKNARKASLLHHAVDAACPLTVKWLVNEVKLDPDLMNDNSYTPRQLADSNKGRGWSQREVYDFLCSIPVDSLNQQGRPAKRPKRVSAQRAQQNWEDMNRASREKAELQCAKQESMKHVPVRENTSDENCPEAERLLSEWYPSCCRCRVS